MPAKELSASTGVWTQDNVREQIKKDYTNYNHKDMKQAQLVSSQDHVAAPTAVQKEKLVDEYTEKL